MTFISIKLRSILTRKHQSLTVCQCNIRASQKSQEKYKSKSHFDFDDFPICQEVSGPEVLVAGNAPVVSGSYQLVINAMVDTVLLRHATQPRARTYYVT